MDTVCALLCGVSLSFSVVALTRVCHAFVVMSPAAVVSLCSPRVGFEDNETFLNMMEQYYDQPEEVKLQDVRRDLKYQVGVTPNFVEVSLPPITCVLESL